MKSKALPLFILALVVAAIGVAIYLYRNELKSGASDQLNAQLKAKSGSECWYSRACGDLAYYECGDDSPAYYVDLKNERTLGRCGSLCKGDMLRCQNECPPAAWACDFHEASVGSVPKLLQLNDELGKKRNLNAVLRPFDPPYPLVGAAVEPAPEVKKNDVFAAPGAAKEEE